MNDVTPKPMAMGDIESYAVFDYLQPGELVEVTEIAFVTFDIDGELDTFRCFPETGNGHADAHTVDFWMLEFMDRLLKQKTFTPPEWLRARARKETQPMVECLQELTEFLRGYSHTRQVWCKSRYGSMFDLEVLRAHYAARGMSAPWEQHNQRDLNPLLWEVPVPSSKTEVTHDALQDARNQLEILLECKKILAGKGEAV